MSHFSVRPGLNTSTEAAVLTNLANLAASGAGFAIAKNSDGTFSNVSISGGTTLTVPQGGTGNTTFTAYSVITAGTTATGAFQNVSGLGSSGYVLTSNGAGALPTWQAVSTAGLTIGTTTITSGTNGRILYDNSGVVGEMTTTGSGTVVVLATGASLVTPALGVATATSIAIGGATLGSNALAVTGHLLFEGVTSTGATGTGLLVFGTSPTLTTASLGSSTATTQSPFDNSTKVATTAYVDAATISMDSKPSVAYASTSALPSNTYANGSSGVGATLTGIANGPLIIDSVTILVGQVGERVLVAGEAAPANNGWYTITQQGTVAVSPYILTRATESDQAAEIGAGFLTSVIAPNSVTPGTANNGKVFISVAADPFTVGTTSLTFSQVGGTYTNGTGIGLSGNTFSLIAPVTVALGGTNATSASITAFNNITGYSAAGATGTTSTNLVFSTSPTLVTPTLGVATVTSVNKMAITAPASSSTLAVADGKTFTASNTITLAANADGQTFTFPSVSDTVDVLGTAQTFTAVKTFTPAARSSGVASYFIINIPADTAQTAATESIGFKTVTATRTWATTGTVALQRENYFAGVTYASASASQTFTDIATMYIDKPIAGTNAIFTRAHSLAIVDSTSAASSVTGGLVVATTLGTTATSVGIGGGNINAGGTLIVGGHVTFEGVTSTGATGTGKLVFDGTPTLVTPNIGQATATNVIYTNNAVTASGNAATVPVTSRLTTVTNNSAATLTITITTAGATDGQLVMVRILDFSAVAQTITWVNTENSTVSAPATSNGSTTLFLTAGFIYNSGTSKWRCIANA